MIPKYIHRKREYKGKVQRAFGGWVDTYTEWVTVGQHPDLISAAKAINAAPRVGMFVHALFHKGRRVRENLYASIV